MEKTWQKDLMTVRVFPTRKEMGLAAAQDAAHLIKQLAQEKGEVNIIFAAAPSQNELLAGLREDKTIPWECVNAFHMDEYVALDSDAPQGFANFLKNALFDHVPFRSVNCLDSTANADQEAKRYAALLEKTHIDLVCMGVGENGHIAFNDPHVADFFDGQSVKTVDLDETCRMQQVHDGCFASLDDVPRYALTLTVPVLMRADYHICVVPAAAKAEAIRRMINEPVGPQCPASALRLKANSVLYCDADSASLL